jgi:hypothetical protein
MLIFYNIIEKLQKIQKYNQETERLLYEFIHVLILLIPRLIFTFIQVMIIFNLLFIIFV